MYVGFDSAPSSPIVSSWLMAVARGVRPSTEVPAVAAIVSIVVCGGGGLMEMINKSLLFIRIVLHVR